MIVHRARKIMKQKKSNGDGVGKEISQFYRRRIERNQTTRSYKFQIATEAGGGFNSDDSGTSSTQCCV